MLARSFLFGLLLVALLGVPAHCAIISQWKFDNNLNDSVGPNNLSPTGSPTFSGSVAPGGFSSNALSVTSGSYVRDTTPAGLNFTSAYTVAGWFNLQGNTTPQFRSLFWRGIGTTNSDIEIYLQPTGDNRITVAHNRANSGVFGGSYYPAPTLNGYMHLAVAWNGSAFTVYYDGVPQAVSASFGTAGQPLAVTAGHEVRFGSIAYHGANAALNGLLDEWSVYDNVLSQQQISYLIEFNDVNGPPPPAPEPSTLMLLGFSLLGLKRLSRRRRQ